MKNYQNRLTFVEVIARYRFDVFEKVYYHHHQQFILGKKAHRHIHKHIRGSDIRNLL